MATGVLLLCGCARATLEPVGRVTGEVVSARPARPGAVIAAGASDSRTGAMAAELARRTGFGFVVPGGAAGDAEGGSGARRRDQVSRPRASVPGTPPSGDVQTDTAYERRVLEAARGPLTFYAEIHGDDRREAADRIEIATVGVDLDEARRLRTLLELCRDAHLRGHPGAPRLEARVAPADPIVHAASGSPAAGLLPLAGRGLHIELPPAAREEWREVYTAVLADFLAQAAALPPMR